MAWSWMGTQPSLAMFAAIVAEMRQERIAVLLAGQNSAMALALADRVIDDGRILHSAPARELEPTPPGSTGSSPSERSPFSDRAAGW